MVSIDISLRNMAMVFQGSTCHKTMTSQQHDRPGTTLNILGTSSTQTNVYYLRDLEEIDKDDRKLRLRNTDSPFSRNQVAVGSLLSLPPAVPMILCLSSRPHLCKDNEKISANGHKQTWLSWAHLNAQTMIWEPLDCLYVSLTFHQ